MSIKTSQKNLNSQKYQHLILRLQRSRTFSRQTPIYLMDNNIHPSFPKYSRKVLTKMKTSKDIINDNPPWGCWFYCGIDWYLTDDAMGGSVLPNHISALNFVKILHISNSCTYGNMYWFQYQKTGFPRSVFEKNYSEGIKDLPNLEELEINDYHCVGVNNLINLKRLKLRVNTMGFNIFNLPKLEYLDVKEFNNGEKSHFTGIIQNILQKYLISILLFHMLMLNFTEHFRLNITEIGGKKDQILN